MCDARIHACLQVQGEKQPAQGRRKQAFVALRGVKDKWVDSEAVKENNSDDGDAVAAEEGNREHHDEEGGHSDDTEKEDKEAEDTIHAAVEDKPFADVEEDA